MNYVGFVFACFCLCSGALLVAGFIVAFALGFFGEFLVVLIGGLEFLDCVYCV